MSFHLLTIRDDRSLQLAAGGKIISWKNI